MADLKTLSKQTWRTESTTDSTLQLSCLMRIADASEAMAANYNRMQADKEYYEKRYREEQASNEKLRASNASLRGVITRMKNNGKKGNEAGSEDTNRG